MLIIPALLYGLYRFVRGINGRCNLLTFHSIDYSWNYCKPVMWKLLMHARKFFIVNYQVYSWQKDTMNYCTERSLWLHCTLSLAAQCIVIGPVWVCGCVCLFVCGSVTTITRNCVIDPHQTGFVGKGSDHLQLIKFWPSRGPGKGVCDGAKFFGSALLQPACSVRVSPNAFFISSV